MQVSNNGNFEGPEPASWWEDSDKVVPPPQVMAQLQSPHLVLVRPAAVDMPFRDFLARLRDANATRTHLSRPSVEDSAPQQHGACGAGDATSPEATSDAGDQGMCLVSVAAGSGESETGELDAAGPSEGVPSFYIEYLSLDA